MSEPIEIQYEQSRRFLAGDYLQLRVDGVLQTDRIQVWSGERGIMGFGHGRFGHGGFGFGHSLGFGNGAFGRGHFGQGARVTTWLSKASFVAGDYSIEMRAVDALGNAGDWSDPVTYQHRPNPPAPRQLRISGGALTWLWSDD